ncbi:MULTISPECIES: ammonium transporter [unclassified Streptomyces]|uniref:ammonium transporter n=1 Tax=unclassified Streptomyces TaxID=2593676 RepID=UPI000DC7B5EF|nr:MULTISPECIES: ammonium transporter [unclassified Streptomyces]AWZ03964.1 ammonia channel protein [Streptomyces sp. ICC4]AWZ11476.1 ammonia channel protein [Streptomyces sp. ICC1]
MNTLFDSGNTAWLMMASAMVLLMAPGLAFFYGGMVKTGQIIAMLKMCFVCVAFVTLIWWAVGYTLAFGPDAGGLGVIGTLDHAFMHGIGLTSKTGDVPTVIYSMFHMCFAIVTVALISGSVAGRAKMGGWIVFVIVWTLLVYIPMAHWVFDPAGWVARQVGAVDFSGGTVVELSSGAAGLALAIVAGKRKDFERQTIRPHNLPLVVIGLALLWFGWFGFNAGSYLTGPGSTAMALLNTQFAAGAAMAGWAVTSFWRTRHVTLLDMCMGAVTGMVSMTPLAAGITPVWATITGFLAGLTCAFAISWKYRLGVDDTLDVVGIHGWGGLFGMVMAGLAATGAVTGKKGLFYGGSWDLLGRQLIAVVVLGLFSFVMTAAIGKVIDKTVGLRQPGGIIEDEQAYERDVTAQLQSVTDALRGSDIPTGKDRAAQIITQLQDLLTQREHHEPTSTQEEGPTDRRER